MSHYLGPLIAEVHQVAAGSQLDGTIPSNESGDDHGVRTFVEDSAGGLFELRPSTSLEDFDESTRKRIIEQIILKLGGQSAWSISISDGTTDIVVLSGNTETDVVLTDKIQLNHNEKLKIATTGASAALRAVVQFGVGNDLK